VDRVRIPGANARRVREKLGISCGEFALLTGVYFQTVMRWEADERGVTGAAAIIVRWMDQMLSQQRTGRILRRLVDASVKGKGFEDLLRLMFNAHLGSLN